MTRLPNYAAYHVHTHLSLLDSCTDFKEYVDYAVELGQTAIAFSEHGKPLQWISKKMYCDEKGIKYLHAVECYLTETHDEKVRDNFHTVLIARNHDGVLELNEAISRSCNPDHFYYVNRLSFDEFFKLSNNIIKISACLASPLNKLPISHPRYEALVKHYDYLEIQPHNCEEQIAFNIHLATLADKYKKPLIAGTDAHSLNSYKAECRKILLKAKHKSYGDEDAYDLTYKTYDELVGAFNKQDALPENIFLQAIENTNVMANSVEDFELDKSLKYPILYGTREKDKEVFQETINRKFNEKIQNGIIPQEQIEAYKAALTEEQRVFSKIQMDGFMLSMSELISWCKKNDIPVGNARGSVGGSRVAYVTDIIDLNPETWNTVFSRFCNEFREEVGDIDVDVVSTDRPKIFEYIVNRFGTSKTARVPSFGTLAGRSVIEEIGRALRFDFEKEHTDETNPYSVGAIDGIKKEFDFNEDITRRKYPEIFYYYDGLVGTKISQSVHPAGMVISPVTLADNYGVFEKDGDMCLMVDMEEVHECGLVKYDFLILNNIKIISDTYKMLGKPYPKSHEIDWNDPEVWNDMLKSPVGIFQMESPYAYTLLCQYRPKNIFDMSLVTACIRPSGASYRDRLMKHTPNKNPSEIIDELLKDNGGYLVYQEDIIKFLQEICGMSGSEADNVRRAIGRKDADRLQKALPQILEGYCEKSNQPRNVAEEEAKEFLQIIEDASSYMFGLNHSIAYCLIGYLCAYLRYYHPYEFITSYLNNAANEQDITNGTEVAELYGIRITPPRYGASKDEYCFNVEENFISKGISSVKYLNSSVSNELYDVSQVLDTKYFMDVLLASTNFTSMNSRQLDILIKIGYFDEFGNCNELLKIAELFDFFKQGTAKTISKDKMPEVLKDIVKDFVSDTNAKGKELKSYTITNMYELLIAVEEYIRSMNLPDLSYKLKAAAQNDYLGYVDLTTGKEEDRRKLYILDMHELEDRFKGGIWKYKIKTKSIGSGKVASLDVDPKVMQKHPIRRGDVIYAASLSKDKKDYWQLNDYQLVV